MKIFIIALLFLCIVPLASAGELKIKGYIKPDPLRGDNNYLIHNKHGKATGRVSPDPLRSASSSGHYLIYDKKGNQTGRIRPDYIDSRRYIIETVKDD